MRAIGILLIVTAFIAQMMSTSLILLNYKLNTSYIIENFCENTDKPELNCNGKCHLAKQIKADTDQRSETPVPVTEIVTFVLAIEEIPSFKFCFNCSEPDGNHSLYLEGNYSKQLQSIFHPPQIV